MVLRNHNFGKESSPVLSYSKNEQRGLITQLLGFSEHFLELSKLVQVLRPNINNKNSQRELATRKWYKGKEGELKRPVWTSLQNAKFRDLVKEKMFSILNGGHIFTRNTTMKIYHPYSASDPVRCDVGKVKIVANFRPTSTEHVLILRGDSEDHHFRKLATKIIKERPTPLKAKHQPLQKIRPLSLTGGNEPCWQSELE